MVLLLYVKEISNDEFNYFIIREPCADGKYGGKELFKFEDIFNSTFTPKTFDVQWIRLSGQFDNRNLCCQHCIK